MPFEYGAARVCAIIPTFAPGELTLQLVRDLVKWNPKILVYVVDDCTPGDMGKTALFETIVSVSDRVTLLRTSENKLKAGALNHALKHVYTGKDIPDVILTLDDDVVIEPSTVRNLVLELMSCDSVGAACSQCRVYNKNKNLLTRLQGLEYLGFNAIRLADEGFYRGPLVMHGMLTAFRGEALHEAGGFSEGHLIEDYEVTTRLKENGWSVKSIQNAPAATFVPETLSRLWRQRTRWSYGGLTVVARAKSPLAVFQDLQGHTVFVATLGIVAALLFFKSGNYVPESIANWIIGLSLAQLGIWYVFQLWLMRLYEERDIYDWLIRVTIFPEFLYGYVMTLALLGSYFFHSFNVVARGLVPRGGRRVLAVVGAVRTLFRMIGYAERNWGNRSSARTL